MLGFKGFRRAKVTIAGIELRHRIRRNEFDRNIYEHLEQGFRRFLGVLRLFRELDKIRAEAVSARAVAYDAFTTKASPRSFLFWPDRATVAVSEPQAVIDQIQPIKKFATGPRIQHQPSSRGRRWRGHYNAYDGDARCRNIRPGRWVPDYQSTDGLFRNVEWSGNEAVL